MRSGRTDCRDRAVSPSPNAYDKYKISPKGLKTRLGAGLTTAPKAAVLIWRQNTGSGGGSEVASPLGTPSTPNAPQN